MEEVISGLKIGIILSLIISPTFLIILHHSINKGKCKAIMFCLGLWTSDILHSIVFSYWSKMISEFLTRYKIWFAALSSGIILLLGFKILSNTIISKVADDKIEIDSYYKYYMSGLVLAITSPGTSLVWIGITGWARSYNYSQISYFIFVSVIISIVIIFDVIKIYFSNIISSMIINKRLNIINTIIGVLLVIGAAFIFIKYVLQV